MRLAAVRTKEPAEANSEVYVVPDGVLHPRYSHRSSGIGKYILCRKSIIPLLEVRGLHHRILYKKKAVLHSLLEQQIVWQLRERIIQVVRFILVLSVENSIRETGSRDVSESNLDCAHSSRLLR